MFAPTETLHRRGRACPARGIKISGRLRESCGPHMCGPYNSTHSKKHCRGGVLTPPRADMGSAPTERAAMLRGV